MAIQFSCSCGKLFSVRDEVAGKRARCPNCDTMLKVPMPGGQSAAAPSAVAPPTAQPQFAAQAMPGQPQFAAQMMPAPPRYAAQTTPTQPGYQYPMSMAPAPFQYYAPQSQWGVMTPPIAHATKPVAPASKLLYAGVISAMMVLYFAVVALFIRSAIDEAIPPLWLLLFILVAIATTVTLHARLVYRMWASIQDGHARTSAAMAVGMLFVPFYNFYWIFRAFYGFAGEYNRYIERQGLSVPRLGGGLFMTYAVLCLVGMVPYIGVLAILPGIFVMIAMIATVVDAINNLARTDAAKSDPMWVYFPATAALFALLGVVAWISFTDGHRMVRRWANGTFTSDNVNMNGLPTSGPPDRTLTFDAVRQNPSAYRGHRVAWRVYPRRTSGRRVIFEIRENKDFRFEKYGDRPTIAVDFASEAETEKIYSEKMIVGTIAGAASVEVNARGDDTFPSSHFDTMVILVHPTLEPIHDDSRYNTPNYPQESAPPAYAPTDSPNVPTTPVERNYNR